MTTNTATATGTGRSARRWDVEGTLGRVRADTVDTAVRLRAQIGPHAAAGGVLVAGLGMEAVVAAGAVSAPSMAAVATATSAATAAGLALRARRRGSQWVRRLLASGAAATAWLTVAPFGVEPGSVAVLVAAEYALAARWWQAHRPGYPDAPDPAVDELADEPEPQPSSTAEHIIADWDRYIACSGGPLEKSQLIAPQEHDHGVAYTLRLWRGRHTLTTAIAALERIASGLDCGVDQIIIESHPQLKGAALRLQVITNSPIAGDVVFDGPRRDGGLLELGPYADGSGEAVYRLYTPGSMWSGVIIGGTGIGKSRLVENIVISALSGGDTEFWYLDPARGGSSPALAGHADWFVSMDQTDDMLDAAIAILDARAEENAVEGWTGFTPSPQRPGLLIVVEECHNPFGGPAARAEKWARIAREGRKVGLALLCVSQYPGLVTFGGNEALRSSVMEGNALVLRSTSNQTGQLMAGLTVDPKALPKIPGYAYVQGSDETGIRTAPFRNRNTEPNDGPGASRWLAAQPRPGLDTLSVTATVAAGTAYRDRHTATTTSRAGSRARIEALRNGHLPDTAPAAPQAAHTPATTPAACVVDFPTFQLDAAERTDHQDLQLSPSHRAVLGAVIAGASRPRDIETATGLKRRRVAELLKDLVETGHLTQPKYGRYQVA